MSIQTVTAEILQGNFTNDQLSSIIDSVKYARSKLTRHTIRSLMVGDNVSFDSTKLGRNVTGVVTKIAIKYVTVRTATGLWKVPANMLTLIEDKEYA
jgi:small-conductance mechanosensitive channel